MIELIENKSKSILEASSEHTHASQAKQKFLGISRHGTVKHMDKESSLVGSQAGPSNGPLTHTNTWSSNQFGYQEDNEQTAQATREQFKQIEKSENEFMGESNLDDVLSQSNYGRAFNNGK